MTDMNIEDAKTLTNCWGILAGRVGSGEYKQVVLTKVDGNIRVEMHSKDDVRVIDVHPSKKGIKPFIDFMLTTSFDKLLGPDK